ncbi:MAG: BolA family protein [Pseudomonadota bacterium]
MATMEERIASALGALQPRTLEVVNESHLHAGHAGDDGSGESHWRVVIAVPGWAGKTRLAKHRAVHAALGEIMGEIHALALDITE